MEHFLALFGLPLLACMLMLAVLAYLGIYVLKREIVFIDIAMAQTVVVGMVVGHLAFGVHLDSWAGYGCGVGIVLVAAAFYAFARSRVRQIPLEAIIGISYVVAAAAVLFLVGLAPGGHIHVHGMLAGSILWVTWKDIAASGAIFAVAAAGFWLFRRPFSHIFQDYAKAAESGMNIVAWDIVWYGLAGLVIAWVTRIAGVLLTFAFLIVPAVFSAVFSRRDGTRLLIGWAFGLGATVLGLLFADRLDFSVGPSISLFLVVGLALAAGSRVWGRPATVGLSLAAAAALLLLLSMGGRGGFTAPPQRNGRSTPVTPSSPSARSSGGLSEADLERRIQHARTISELDELLGKVTDPQFRAQIACRALELDPVSGRELARKFLQQKPPLFFRQMVLDALEAGNRHDNVRPARDENHRGGRPGS